MVYSVSMKYIFIVFVCCLLTSCTIHLKAKDLELDSEPVEPGVKWSNATYEVEKIDILKER